MRVAEAEFFKEATIRICGSLQLEEALFNLLTYVSALIPIDEIYVIYGTKIGTTRIYAYADHKGGELRKQEMQFPQNVLDIINTDRLPSEYLNNRPDDHFISKHLLRALGKSKVSHIYIRLFLGEKRLGGILFSADGWDRFNEEHVNLLKMLREPISIAVANSRKFRELVKLRDTLTDDNQFFKDELRSKSESEIIGANSGLKDVMDLVRMVAPSKSTALLIGETGVGKEIIASSIHNLSSCRTGPFIKVDCGAIPETLVDSTLFGQEKGAFTGSYQQVRGRFERADGGTIFLDEIGELPLQAQTRLLRVLQEHEIERVGGDRPVKVNIRLICATHRDLCQMSNVGKFRSDLFFRINVFPINIPPLRDRKDDIPSLVQYFILKKMRGKGQFKFPLLASGEIDRLISYEWPGNVRELENMVERSLIVNHGGTLRFGDLTMKIDDNNKPNIMIGEAANLNLNAITSLHVRRVLQMTNGKVAGHGGAAELMGINPSTLRHKMRILNIHSGRRNYVYPTNPEA